MLCLWCEQQTAAEASESVYWELPDGTRALEITSVPSFRCSKCHAVYQSDELVKELENQLFIIDTKSLENIISYDELMNKPKLLKRNYFDFGHEAN
ncbi:MAG: YokU family protein [Bacillus sp. (in: firmicutes)]